MENQPLNLVIKQLVLCLKSVNEPVSVDELILFSNISVKDLPAFKSKLETLMSIAVQLGLVKEHNGHYFAATHPEDIWPQLREDSASNLSIVGSGEKFIEASLMFLTGDEPFQENTGKGDGE